MNLDETRCTRIPGRGKGNVFISKRDHQQCPEPTQRATRAQLRGGLTHVGIVASRLDVQQTLPQVMVCNEHVPALATLRAVEPQLIAQQIIVLRQKSSWTSTPVLCAILDALAEALAPWATEVQPILLLDCAKSHVGWRVAASAARHNIWLAYIPAHLTWLLQPLDTHVFAAFKASADAAYAALRSESPSGEVSDTAWLQLLVDTVTRVVKSRSWGHAFQQNGFSSVDAVRREIVAELGPGPLPSVPFGRPTLADLHKVYPAKCKVPERLLWRGVDGPRAPKALGAKAAGVAPAAGLAVLAPPPPAAPAEPPDAAGPSDWHRRLRPGVVACPPRSGIWRAFAPPCENRGKHGGKKYWTS